MSRNFFKGLTRKQPKIEFNRSLPEKDATSAELNVHKTHTNSNAWRQKVQDVARNCGSRPSVIQTAKLPYTDPGDERYPGSEC